MLTRLPAGLVLLVLCAWLYLSPDLPPLSHRVPVTAPLAALIGLAALDLTAAAWRALRRKGRRR